MAWMYLAVAGILAAVWAFFMTKSERFSLLTPRVITIITMSGTFAPLSIAMRSLPLGTAYAIWTGIGAVGAFVVGIVILGEAATFFRIASVTLILAGIIGLKLSSS